MSVKFSSVRDSGQHPGQEEGATVGGLKPLHRFLKGQPKATGIVVLILGASLCTSGVEGLSHNEIADRWTPYLPILVTSGTFMASGILYILTENNPTKRNVTISLALSIISVLCMVWLILHSVPNFQSYHDFNDFHHFDNTTITSFNYHMSQMAVETVNTLNCIVGGMICLVMSVLAGAALRSTKSQAIVLMTTMANQAPID